MNQTLLRSLLLIILATAAVAQTEPRAARSVHLWWPGPAAEIFYNEVTVEQSVPGSYFMACGFKHGYFGIQELANGRKVVLFSVWDPSNSSDSAARAENVPADARAEVLHQDPDVRVTRFGGEGTGAKSMWDYAWKPGETCRFCVRATVEGEKTSFAAFFRLTSENRWKHLATFRTVTKGAPLRGLYSFIEDFRRDGKSPHEMRQARFGPGWVRTKDGDWVALNRATFTADKTPLENVDAGLAEGGFFLATGGETKNATKLGTTLVREPFPVPQAGGEGKATPGK